MLVKIPVPYKPKERSTNSLKGMDNLYTVKQVSTILEYLTKIKIPTHIGYSNSLAIGVFEINGARMKDLAKTKLVATPLPHC